MKKILKKKNIKYYLIYYIIIELISKGSVIQGLINIFYNFFKIINTAPSFEIFIKEVVILLITVILWGLSIIVITAPITVTLLAMKSADITQERQNKKYTSRENIIYYREKLNGISPTTISLMQNLKIEEEKDFVATIIKLQLNKNISIEENNIKILSDDISNLTENEKQVFYMVSNEKINRKQIEDWNNIAVQEAKLQGYIKEKNSSKGLWTKKIILFGVLLLFVLGVKHSMNNTEWLENGLNEMEATNETTIFEIVDSENSDTLVNAFFQAGILIVSILGILVWPIFYIVYIVRYQNKNNSLKRTIKGEQLTDEIQGMKSFIHDFTMLDEADKEAIKLWDEFVVYAIVLGENEKIIQEILNLKNLKNFDGGLFYNRSDE